MKATLICTLMSSVICFHQCFAESPSVKAASLQKLIEGSDLVIIGLATRDTENTPDGSSVQIKVHKALLCRKKVSLNKGKLIDVTNTTPISLATPMFSGGAEYLLFLTKDKKAENAYNIVDTGKGWIMLSPVDEMYSAARLKRDGHFEAVAKFYNEKKEALLGESKSDRIKDLLEKLLLAITEEIPEVKKAKTEELAASDNPVIAKLARNLLDVNK